MKEYSHDQYESVVFVKPGIRKINLLDTTVPPGDIKKNPGEAVDG